MKVASPSRLAGVLRLGCMVTATAAAVSLLGCGDGLAAPADAAPPPDAAPACTATFSGNFAETSTTLTPCAAFTADGALALAVPSQILADPLAISLAVAASPGDASSETTATWSADATRMIVHDTCLLAAGDQVVPHGSFTLHLTSAAPPHGRLVLDQPVRALQFSACGTPLTEHVEVAF